MKRIFVGTALLAAAVATAPSAQAQMGVEQATAPSFQITPYVGQFNLGRQFDFGANQGFDQDQGLLLGVQAAGGIRALNVFGNVARTRADWTFRGWTAPSGTQTQWQPATFQNVDLWLFDGGVQLRLPIGEVFGPWLAPMAQLGAGAFHIRMDDQADQVWQNQPRTTLAFNAGVGADLMLGPIGIRLMAKDYIGSIGWDQDEWGSARQGFEHRRWAHNWAYTAGLNIGF